ncbi:MAG: bifunctional 4-hydroxy-3-methylbut-2-enyl diphosphate reductase/30S ribosomal protein S1 [Eubacteriales bacterium]|nr:bifunctional 4-hydroxy-3-methylbut-2-enyl diphosphate reductase/30S ribosomal protein S1 [Eubacteriales bacterium]MDD3502564.1 bifunctional 4-hydroxy-3-methylbut-2-enyl diphosphate reductase/30S ribosomal protein S1 [Eubacteriales bacterium]MDD4681686.1 bifunctional 4-hydroxy-3-methylbut-2-enyl diphosphate reductase/30S ribosomal protein S1 [Eubacteriales bacterium]
MKIIEAKSSSFCFGVRNAVNKAYDLINEQSQVVSKNVASDDEATLDRKTYMLGELIHNQTVITELNQGGMITVNSIDEIPAGSRVMIRAHGVPPEIISDLKAKDCEVVDCTCPFVTKIHKLALEAVQKGNKVLIAGSSSHPEVIGIMGEAPGKCEVIETPDQAKKMTFDDEKYVLLSQTTYSVKKFQEICDILKNKIAKFEIFDTICITTENRQNEAEKIASDVDVMLVIGSKGSSNTMKLFDVCKSRCGETYLIEQPNDVLKVMSNRQLRDLTVGVTAGASTPERIIREVIQAMTENEVFENQQEQVDVSFSDFIDSIPQLKRGATVKGVIVRYDSDYVYVDVRDKSEGRIPRHEFDGDPDFDLDQAIQEHTEIDVYVRSIRNSDMGKEILLSKARVDFGKYKALIEEAYQNKEPVTVKVINTVKDGVIATYGGVDIYIHRTQLEMSMVNDLEPYKGQTLEIMITQYDPDKKRLRVSGSRRALLSALRREKAEEVWASIEVGKEYNGIVRSLTDFGAFVDIGGVDGLVHVSELSWNRIRHPSEVVNVGDEINVFVKDFDSEKKRISLGYKRPEDDPYHDVESRFPVGSIVRGIVVRMFPFGAFVEIAPGVDALCHISQISDVRLVKPNDVLAEGMEIDARVLEVSNENRRISISIKEVEPINPVTEMDENAQSSEEANETYVSEQDQFNAPSGELEIPQQEEEIPQQEEEQPEA